VTDYYVGKNITLTARTHAGSIPALPKLGKALQKIKISIPAPHLDFPDDPDDDDPDDPDNDKSPKHIGFIRGATVSHDSNCH
jgi:hypothetical protein